MQQSALQKAANNITQLKYHFTHIKIHDSTSEWTDPLSQAIREVLGKMLRFFLKKRILTSQGTYTLSRVDIIYQKLTSNFPWWLSERKQNKWCGFSFLYYLNSTHIDLLDYWFYEGNIYAVEAKKEEENTRSDLMPEPDQECFWAY